MFAAIAAMCGNQVAGASGTPKAVQLDGVDESILIADLFTGRVTANVADVFSWGIGANLVDTITGPLIGATAGGALDCTASLTVVSGTIRSWAQSSAAGVRRQRTGAGVISAGVNFRVASTWAGTAPSAPLIYVDGVDESANAGSGSSLPNASTSASIGRDGGATSPRAGTFWDFWWTPANLTPTQVSDLDVLLAAADTAATLSFLLAISSASVYIPVLSTDDLTSTTGSIEDLAGNIDGTPFGTEPVDLVTRP